MSGFEIDDAEQEESIESEFDSLIKMSKIEKKICRTLREKAMEVLMFEWFGWKHPLSRDSIY